MKILVAYATKYGSTAEVAEAIAKSLETLKAEVLLLPLNKVRSLSGIDAVVMGAPFYMFRWHKDAILFLSRFDGKLQKVPTAVFALGPFHDVESEWLEIRGQLDRELTKFPWFQPIDVKLFGGKFDPVSLTFPFNMIPALKELPASDIRDWAAISLWAKTVHEKFTAAVKL
jgi:menaquinone-dependent protoporphyrinogen oxidase